MRLLPVLTCVGALALAGCGRQGDDSLAKRRAATTSTQSAPKAPPDQTPAVRAAVADFASATQRKDYRRLCGRVLARELVDRIKRAGLPCEQTLKVGLKDVRNPRVQLQGVEVTLNRAIAKVRSSADGQDAYDGTLSLIREPSGWKIASLVAPAP